MLLLLSTHPSTLPPAAPQAQAVSVLRLRTSPSNSNCLSPRATVTSEKEAKLQEEYSHSIYQRSLTTQIRFVRKDKVYLKLLTPVNKVRAWWESVTVTVSKEPEPFVNHPSIFPSTQPQHLQPRHTVSTICDSGFANSQRIWSTLSIKEPP